MRKAPSLAAALRFIATVFILLGPLMAADTALVQTTTYLRKDPSAHNRPIWILLTGDEVAILDSRSSSTYLKVRTEDKRSGWVLRTAVEILAEVTPSPPPDLRLPPPPGVAISPDWPKPAPVDVAFAGSEGSCPGRGDGGDTATNARKNRSDPLPPPNDVPWAAIASLAYPAAPPSRAQWTAAQLAAIKPYEGVALRTTGFLTHTVNVENQGSGESTNCHLLAADEVDWHIYLQGSAADGMSKAVIAETTPRLRKLHAWDVAVLNKWVGAGKPVRITGFLMLDPEHSNQVRKYRGTVWEIHPVTNIEVCNTTACNQSDWVALEQAH